MCFEVFTKGGIEDAALFDVQRPGRPSEITDDAKAWMINLACQRPAELGYAQELVDFDMLSINTFRNMQKKQDIQDLQPLLNLIFRNSSRNRISNHSKSGIIVRSEIQILNQKCMKFSWFTSRLKCSLMKMVTLIVPDDYKLTITVSYDEKPGIQAISNTAPDLRPTTEHGEVYRDAEYKRLGTLSLLAGIDLLTGEAIPLVSETHKSSDFIEFLKILDKKYPLQDTIRIILDNHSAHTSKETQRFLDTMPKGRFKFVFTPKHGSWLNMIESFFSKMTKQMLRGIRVKTKQELEERIYQYFEEVNREPVVYHWKYKMDEISEAEASSI